MNELELLKLIVRNPHVDEPRLAFANLIENKSHAEFIRAQCKLPHILKDIDDKRGHFARLEREKIECEQDEAAFNPYELWNHLKQKNQFHIYKQSDQAGFDHNDRFAAALYERGFIKEFDCFFGFWLDVAQYLKYEPIQFVRIKGKFPLNDSAGWYWRVGNDWKDDRSVIPPELVDLAEVPSNRLIRFETQEEAMKYLSDRCIFTR